MKFYFDRLFTMEDTSNEYYVVYHQKKVQKDRPYNCLYNQQHRTLLGIIVKMYDGSVLPHLIYGKLRHNKTIFKAIPEFKKFYEREKIRRTKGWLYLDEVEENNDDN